VECARNRGGGAKSCYRGTWPDADISANGGGSAGDIGDRGTSENSETAGRAQGYGTGGRRTGSRGCEGPDGIGSQAIAELILSGGGDRGGIRGASGKSGGGRKGGNHGGGNVRDCAGGVGASRGKSKRSGGEGRGVHRFAEGSSNDRGVGANERGGVERSDRSHRGWG